MAAMSPNAYYHKQQVTTVSKGQLLLMVYDSSIRFLQEARQAMVERNYELQNTNINKTQALLMELICTLDHGAFPELANNLDRLYRYMFDQLTEANVYDKPEIITQVSAHLTELRGAWGEAEKIVRSQSGQAELAVGGHAA